MSVAYFERVFVSLFIQHAMCMRRVILSSAVRLAAPHCQHHLLSVLLHHTVNIICCLSCCTTLSTSSHTLRDFQLKIVEPKMCVLT